MTTILAVALLAVFFVLFAILGPAERSKPCGGRKPGESRCDSCPLGTGEGEPTAVCPGAEKLRKRATEDGGAISG
jgi:hypothetical protein